MIKEAKDFIGNLNSIIFSENNQKRLLVFVMQCIHFHTHPYTEIP